MRTPAEPLQPPMPPEDVDAENPSHRKEVRESLLSGAVVQLLLLATGILAARLLGEEGRGQQALIWVVALISVQVGIFGLPLALTYEIARGRATARQLLDHVTSIVLAQIAAIVAVYGAITLLLIDDRIPAAAALVTILALPAMVWQAYGLALIQGRHEFRQLHILRSLPTALYAVGLGMSAIFVSGSVFVVMATWSLAYVVGAVATQIVLRRFGEPEGVPTNLPGRRQLWRFGATGFLGASSPTETFRVDQLAVGVILTTADLALYTTALAFCNLPRFLVRALGLVAYARVAAADGLKRKRRLLARFTLTGVAVAVAVALPLAVFAEPLIDLTFGPEFTDAAGITRILLGATVLLCAQRMLSECLRGFGLPSAGTVAELVSLISLVPALLLLVPPLGLEGFAIAISVSYAFGLISITPYLFLHPRGDLDSGDPPE